MNLCDRIYVVVHIVLAVLVCARLAHVAHWPWYVAWNLAVITAIVHSCRKQHASTVWEFTHDWLPSLLFITVFEEVSFLSLSLRSDWQNLTVIAWESALFPVPPGEWLHRYSVPWFSELLEFGYFTFYPLYPIVAGVLWAWRSRPQFSGAFRRLTDSLSVGYAVCYASYLLFPTRSPSHNSGLTSPAEGGPFHHLVQLFQRHAGVHGNAFPSAHIMMAFAVLIFTVRYLPRLTPWLLICVLLMCFGAVYDGYHYLLDVIAGGLLGIVVGTAFLARRPASAGR